VSEVCFQSSTLESKPQDCRCRGLCKFRRIHYGLAKNACSQCSKSRTGTHKVKFRLLFQLTRCTNRACCQFHPVKMFIKTTVPRDKRNQNSERFFRLMSSTKYLEVFGCLQIWVFNPKLGLSTAVKCNPVFRVCVNQLSIHIPDN
jgi:hypothetical protein